MRSGRTGEGCLEGKGGHPYSKPILTAFLVLALPVLLNASHQFAVLVTQLRQLCKHKLDMEHFVYMHAQAFRQLNR